MLGLLYCTFIVVLMMASNQFFYCWADSNSLTTVQKSPQLQLMDDTLSSWNLPNITLGVLEPVFTFYTKECNVFMREVDVALTMLGLRAAYIYGALSLLAIYRAIF